MIRRTFLKLLALVCVFVTGCSQKLFSKSDQNTIKLNDIPSLHKYWTKAYNNGNIESLLKVFDSGCTFVSDSIDGDFIKLKRMLKVVYQRQKQQNLLPISYQIKFSKLSGNIGWSLLTIRTNRSAKTFGNLTVLAYKTEKHWQIVHYHFSR